MCGVGAIYHPHRKKIVTWHYTQNKLHINKNVNVKGKILYVENKKQKSMFITLVVRGFHKTLYKKYKC